MSVPIAHTKRICQIIKLKPEYEAEYINAHANVWPSVLSALARHNIADYSINYYKPLQLLIATFKYTGSDLEKDMADIAADPETQRWWELTDRMQESFQEGATGSGGSVPWWTDVPEVFRFEGLEPKAS
ncbi:rhamnose mutarotase [Trametopsis cervina]|nr:rhamnose mutarotase [Trametopsis cervina]